MLKKIFSFASFLTIFALIAAVPLSALAQDVGSFQPIMDQQQQPMNFQQPGGTCNVNGVEMPGSCDQYNQQMGPGGGPGGMMGGPSEEEMQKMDEQRQAQEKKMRARGLEQMKKGIKQFAKGLKQVESRIAKLEKQNVPIPAELKDRITQAKTAVEAILAATDPEEVQDQMESMQEMGDMMQEIMPRLEMLARLPQMIKKADSEIKKLEKAYKQVSAKLQRAKIDATSILDKWQVVINELKANLEVAKSGQFSEDEDPMQMIGEGIFERMEEAWRYRQTAEMLLNVKRNLKQVAAALKRYDKAIIRLEKKGEDMAEARSMLNEMKAKYEEVNNLVIDKMDPDEVEEVLGGLDYYMELQQTLEEMLNMGGPSMFEQQMKAPPTGGMMPQLQMPQFEKMMYDVQNLEKEITQQWSEKQETLLAQSQAEKMKKLNTLAVLLKAVKSKMAELAKDGVVLPAELQEGVANTLAALSSSSAVAQR